MAQTYQYPIQPVIKMSWKLTIENNEVEILLELSYVILMTLRQISNKA